MPELLLHLAGDDPGTLVPELSWRTHRCVGAPVDLRLDPRDLRELHWLWDDPSVDMFDPGSGRRLRADQAVRRIGVILGKAFASGQEMQDILEDALVPGAEPVVLVSSSSDEVLSCPWEIARTPSGALVSDLAAGLARRRQRITPAPPSARTGSGPLRVLMVVSRPDAHRDVDYRAVARGVLERLEGRGEVRLVRPGTFQAFEREVNRGRWDLVHYDGHGTAGGLAFEDGIVRAERLGQVLAGAGIPLFALNACRSAQMDRSPDLEEREVASVALALLDAGAEGVVAMGASVRVGTAAVFFDRFYEQMAAGATLAHASQQARRAMVAGPGSGPLDWAVPVLYQRGDAAPFAGRTAPGEASPHDRLLGGEPPLRPRPGGVFLGREGELFRVDRALDDHPRVLVFGVAGVGKTTLIEHLLDWRRRTGGAGRVLTFRFRHAPSLEALGQNLQSEAALLHPDVVPVVAGPEWQGLPLEVRLGRLASLLASGDGPPCLLVFDDVEVMAGYPDPGGGPYSREDRDRFRQLLGALEGAGCRVLMASRRDEVELLGDAVRRLHLSGVPERERLPLLVAYCRAFASDERLREAMAGEEGGRPMLDHLLRVMGGHPLATRVAAYALRERTVGAVVAGIQGRAERLRVPVPEEGGRSESLEHVLVGALEHLHEERRKSLGILGMFAGPFHESTLFRLMGAPGFPDGVLSDRSERALRGVLQEAERLGLLTGADEAGVREGVPGAQDALHRLYREAVAPEEARAVERHLLHGWAAFAASLTEALYTQDRAASVLATGWVEELNLLHALLLAERELAWDDALELLQFLLTAWRMAGRAADADHLRREWLDRLGEASPAGSGPDPRRIRLRIGLWNSLASQHLLSGELEQAAAIHHHVIGMLEADPEHDRALLASVYHDLGFVEQNLRRLDEAERWYRRSIEVEEALGNLLGASFGYHHLGMVEQLRGRLDRAEGWYRRSLEAKSALGDFSGLAIGYHQLGMLEQDRGRLDEAEKWYLQSLEIEEKLGNQLGISDSFSQIGLLEQERGRLDAAEEWYRRSLRIKEEIGDDPGVARVLYHLGMVEYDRGRLGAAEQWFRRSLEIARALNNPAWEAYGLGQLGIVEQARGNLEQAEKWLRESLEIRERLDDRRELAPLLANLGAVLRGRGNLPGALEAVVRAFCIYDDLGLPARAAALADLAALCKSLGRESFLALWSEVGAPSAVLEELSAACTELR